MRAPTPSSIPSPGLFAIVEDAARGADDLDTRFDATYASTEISIDGTRFRRRRDHLSHRVLYDPP